MKLSVFIDSICQLRCYFKKFQLIGYELSMLNDMETSQ